MKKRICRTNTHINWDRHRKPRRSIWHTEYRLLLFSDSQKAPVQFQIPLWSLYAVALFLIALLFALIFSFSNSRHVSRLLDDTNSARQQIEDANLKMEEENRLLKENIENQEIQIKDLQSIAEDTLQKLDSIQEEAEAIRSKLGLQAPEEITENTDAAAVPAASQTQTSTALTIADTPTIAGSPSEDDLSNTEEIFASIQSDLDTSLENYTALGLSIDKTKKKEEAAVSLREQITAYALQFVGNPYVYGGNDPHTGADCSGFTKYIYSQIAGISLNRTAAAQSGQGKTISFSEAKPGDLIFYGSSSNISHVALYIGNDKVVHASTERTGIIVSTWNYRTPVKIENILGN